MPKQSTQATESTDKIINRIYEVFPALNAKNYQPGDMEKLPAEYQNLPERFNRVIERIHKAAEYLREMVPAKEIYKAADEASPKSRGDGIEESRIVKIMSAKNAITDFDKERRRIYHETTQCPNYTRAPDPTLEALNQLYEKAGIVAEHEPYLNAEYTKFAGSQFYADVNNELFSAIMQEHGVPPLPSRKR